MPASGGRTCEAPCEQSGAPRPCHGGDDRHDRSPVLTRVVRARPVTHLTTDELAAFAAGEATEVASAHLRECSECTAELTAIRVAIDAVRFGASAHASQPDACLDDHEIATLAEGVSGGPDARQVEHLAGCGRCRAAVSSARRALSSDGLAREMAALDRRSKARSIRRYLLPLAVAASLALLFLGDRARLPAPDTHRERPITTTPAPRVIAPLGSTENARILRWHRVDGADRYRVTVFDAKGTVLHETSLSDTVAPIPGDVAIDVGEDYFWIVAARTGLDRWVTSDLAAFSVEEVPRR